MPPSPGSGTGAPSKRDMEQRLQKYREEPIAGGGSQDEALAPVFAYLIGDETRPHPPDHWFCAKADPVDREAATFLLRLLAYRNPKVDLWKASLIKCLRACCACVKGLDDAKRASDDT